LVDDEQRACAISGGSAPRGEIAGHVPNGSPPDY
jgi:hypothetical protein